MTPEPNAAPARLRLALITTSGVAIIALCACGDTDDGITGCSLDARPPAGQICACFIDVYDTGSGSCVPNTPGDDHGCGCRLIPGEYEEPEPPPTWRFLLIEDLSTSQNSGARVGLHLDAVLAQDLGEDIRESTTVESIQTGDGELEDAPQVFGRPDAACDPSSDTFVNLGGLDAGGFIVVGFASPDNDAPFQATTSLSIYALDVACEGFTDVPYRVSVSSDAARDTFIDVGIGKGTDFISLQPFMFER